MLKMHGSPYIIDNYEALEKTWNHVLMWQYMLMYFEGVFDP